MRKIIKKVLEILDGTPAVYGKRTRGQSLVETAFIIPILVILLVGIVEIGWFAQNYLNLLESSKVGARRGPFLNGENSPENFQLVLLPADKQDAVIAPEVIDPDLPLPTEPEAEIYRSDPDDPYYWHYMTRSCQSAEEFFGFFNLVACTVLDTMDPLTIRNNNRDDIVVSVFAAQQVKIGGTDEDDVNMDDVGPAGHGYDDGSQVVIVGRYPSNANECDALDPPERDPFDWIVDGEVTIETFTDPFGGPDIVLPYEIAEWDDDISDYVGWLDVGGEVQRGWAFFGQRQVEEGGARLDCWGSAFTSEEVQELLNLPNFIEAGETGGDERREWLPSQGLLLVEIFWDHTLLLEGFPLLSGRFSPVYWALGGNDPDSTASVIHAWAIFPAPAAEPSLLFKPPSEE